MNIGSTIVGQGCGAVEVEATEPRRAVVICVDAEESVEPFCGKAKLIPGEHSYVEPINANLTAFLSCD